MCESYVGSEVTTDKRTGLKSVAALWVRLQRYSFYFRRRTREFAPVQMDLLGMKMDEMRFRPMREGQMETKIWQMVDNQKPTTSAAP